MRRHHAGSGRRPVIGADWAAAHQQVAAATMRGTVALRKPGTSQTWVNNQNLASPLPPYAADVPARVQALAGQARIVQLADDTETIADYLVAVPAGHTAAGGDLVDVTACDDPTLRGLTLRVEKVGLGTERFERDLFCTLAD